jgi:hypothetical protein
MNQLVQRVATGWTDRGSNTGYNEEKIIVIAPVPTGSGAHTASYTMVTVLISGKAGRTWC